MLGRIRLSSADVGRSFQSVGSFSIGQGQTQVIEIDRVSAHVCSPDQFNHTSTVPNDAIQSLSHNICWLPFPSTYCLWHCSGTSGPRPCGLVPVDWVLNSTPIPPQLHAYKTRVIFSFLRSRIVQPSRKNNAAPFEPHQTARGLHCDTACTD